MVHLDIQIKIIPIYVDLVLPAHVSKALPQAHAIKALSGDLAGLEMPGATWCP
jgi:hypothetical protein